ncbi:efflux RND transporter periplasmic adaptor subunit [Nitratireductor kimnyeongensis]|uniref:Efflux RND transporter periplasmic adaptor subunit n=1 Tax=Nitratireductor kimnyeongensis TaxID=430679 RepID=A0ABW0TAF0_9HYPH|nr:efflux RND transporter periplasmic adaptor subunit [Nitratireductor kimnyeongensis]QZZ35869.1 efflux RND transporter periplasmic adaptor subunit [Nitratireductor kimnyeongensis]
MTSHEVDGPATAQCREASTDLDPKRRPKHRPKRHHWLLLLSLAAVLATGIWVFASTRSIPAGSAYMLHPVERGDLVAQVATTAVLRPRTQIEISSELKGTVQSVPVQQSQRIRRGDILATLDSTVFQYAVERAEALVATARASLSDAEISLREAERKLERAQALKARSALSEQKLEDMQAERDRARNKVATARADLAANEADLKLRRFDLSRTTIRSPIDGVVLARKAEPGKTMFASSDDGVLFILAENLEQMELVAKINEADIGTVQPGQQSSFTVEAYPDQTFSATIRDVSFAHKTENDVVTYEANLDVRNMDLRLRPGMTASVSIKTDEAHEALLIPTSALRYRPPTLEEASSRLPSGEPGNSALVHVLENDEPRAVRVKLGVRNWEKAEVVSGLSLGQNVITGEQIGGLLQ